MSFFAPTELRALVLVFVVFAVILLLPVTLMIFCGLLSSSASASASVSSWSCLSMSDAKPFPPF